MSKFIAIVLKGGKEVCINMERIISIEKESGTNFAFIIMSDNNVRYKTEIDYDTFLRNGGIEPIHLTQI